MVGFFTERFIKKHLLTIILCFLFQKGHYSSRLSFFKTLKASLIIPKDTISTLTISKKTPEKLSPNKSNTKTKSHSENLEWRNKVYITNRPYERRRFNSVHHRTAKQEKVRFTTPTFPDSKEETEKKQLISIDKHYRLTTV